MEHALLNWTKSYDVRYNGLTHNFYIASHKTGHFHGALVYIVENENRTDVTRQPAFRIEVEHLIDFTEEAIFKQGLDKLQEAFGSDFEVKEAKTTR